MPAYGFEIVQTLNVDIEPYERVKKAMNEIKIGKVFIISYVKSLRSINLLFNLYAYI